MAKFTLTIECNSQEELIALAYRLNASMAPSHTDLMVSQSTATFPVDIPPEEQPQELETQAEAAPETPAPAKRGRPKKADLKPGDPKLNGNGEKHLPDLDVLKNAVVAAVKAARVPGGNGAVLDLLPDFKEKTGLQFVMDAKDEHRQALLDLVQKAGLELA